VITGCTAKLSVSWFSVIGNGISDDSRGVDVSRNSSALNMFASIERVTNSTRLRPAVNGTSCGYRWATERAP
jgi:hypothetical protein